MSLEFVRKLPTPTEIREQYPLSARATEIKKQRDAEIAKVFTGDSDKFLVIVGPCSADNEDAVLEYNHRLAKVADKVSDKLIIIPRVYTNKPRTTGEGYKGITGADKADILYKVFFGPVTPEVPGSILQFHHDVTLICDEAAARFVEERYAF